MDEGKKSIPPFHCSNIPMYSTESRPAEYRVYTGGCSSWMKLVRHTSLELHLDFLTRNEYNLPLYWARSFTEPIPGNQEFPCCCRQQGIVAGPQAILQFFATVAYSSTLKCSYENITSLISRQSPLRGHLFIRVQFLVHKNDVQCFQLRVLWVND